MSSLDEPPELLPFCPSFEAEIFRLRPGDVLGDMDGELLLLKCLLNVGFCADDMEKTRLLWPLLGSSEFSSMLKSVFEPVSSNDKSSYSFD